MFEIIGIVVVAWLGFVILKAVIGGGTKGVLLRAYHTALEKGVPRDFAKAAIDNSERLISARREMAKANHQFASLELYEQYAVAIVRSYQLFCAKDGQDFHPYKVDYTKPKDDYEITNLIFQAAKIYPAQLKCPRLSYGSFGDLLDRREAGTEYLPDYGGIRSWISIGGVEYGIVARALNPSAGGASGILLSAKVEVEESDPAGVS